MKGSNMNNADKNTITERDLADFMFRARIPVKGSLAITGACNMQCGHCYVDCHWDQGQLPTNKIIDIAHQAYNTGCLYLNLTGGEPLVHRDFSAIYSALYDMGLNVTVTTNAAAISEQIGLLFKKRPALGINISLYGIDADTYDAVTGKPGAFEAFKNGLDILYAHKVPFLLRALMLKTNVCAPEEIEEFADNWNAPVRFFTLIVTHKSARDNAVIMAGHGADS